MAVNEQIVTGRKFRKLIDEASRLWLRISFWTKASDVEFDDGEDAETKISIIQVIINNLKESFNNFKESVQDSLNNIHEDLGGCKIEQEGNDFFIIGADSVRKKLGDLEEGLHFYNSSVVNLYIPGRSGGTSGIVPIDLTKYKIKAFYPQLSGISTLIYPNSASGGDALVDCGVTRVSGSINNNTGAWSIGVNTNGGESYVSVEYTCIYIDK